jgi:metalloendopeptidase OMA1, mitochondrial
MTHQDAFEKRGTWLLGACLAVILASGGCQTNPYTGRTQLVIMPASQDMQLGLLAYRQLLTHPKIKKSTDPRETAPVQRVAARVIATAKQSKYAAMAHQFQWEVMVIKDDKIANAFVLPGGKIAVYTGLFPVAQTEAGLAAVMGHEVVHALARHSAERMSQKMMAQTLLKVTNTVLDTSGARPQLRSWTRAARVLSFLRPPWPP